MVFSSFANEILANLSEDQRVVALEEVNLILGLGDKNIAVIAGSWKARALHFERKFQKIEAIFERYLEGKREVQEHGRQLAMLRDLEDELTEKIIARGVALKEEASHRGKTAADALHDKPNGTREKREAIRAMWASGKYSSRDLCADEEWAALKMSRSTARKALIGQPDPT